MIVKLRREGVRTNGRKPWKTPTIVEKHGHPLAGTQRKNGTTSSPISATPRHERS